HEVQSGNKHLTKGKSPPCSLLELYFRTEGIFIACSFALYDSLHDTGPARIARATTRKPPLPRGMEFPLHRPESHLALLFNSSLNDLEAAMLIERDILGDKGFQVAREALL